MVLRILALLGKLANEKTFFFSDIEKPAKVEKNTSLATLVLVADAREGS